MKVMLIEMEFVTILTLAFSLSDIFFHLSSFVGFVDLEEISKGNFFAPVPC